MEVKAIGTRVYLNLLKFHKTLDLSAVSMERGCSTLNAILCISDGLIIIICVNQHHNNIEWYEL